MEDRALDDWKKKYETMSFHLPTVVVQLSHASVNRRALAKERSIQTGQQRTEEEKDDGTEDDDDRMGGSRSTPITKRTKSTSATAPTPTDPLPSSSSSSKVSDLVAQTVCAVHDSVLLERNGACYVASFAKPRRPLYVPTTYAFLTHGQWIHSWRVRELEDMYKTYCAEHKIQREGDKDFACLVQLGCMRMQHGWKELGGWESMQSRVFLHDCRTNSDPKQRAQELATIECWKKLYPHTIQHGFDLWPAVTETMTMPAAFYKKIMEYATRAMIDRVAPVCFIRVVGECGEWFNARLIMNGEVFMNLDAQTDDDDKDDKDCNDKTKRDTRVARFIWKKIDAFASSLSFAPSVALNVYVHKPWLSEFLINHLMVVTSTAKRPVNLRNVSDHFPMCRPNTSIEWMTNLALGRLGHMSRMAEPETSWVYYTLARVLHLAFPYGRC